MQPNVVQSLKGEDAGEESMEKGSSQLRFALFKRSFAGMASWSASSLQSEVHNWVLAWVKLEEKDKTDVPGRGA